MPLQPADNLTFGGVDSRSNPVNMPVKRSLRCLNWNVAQGGWLELRRGYSIVNATDNYGPVHSIIDFKNFSDGSHYLMIGEKDAVQTIALDGDYAGERARLTLLSGLTLSLPTASRLAFFRGSNQSATNASSYLYFSNGSDGVWFYDGYNVRPSGIRAPTAVECAGVNVSMLMSAPSATDIAGITVAAEYLAGASMSTSSSIGIGILMGYFDPSRNLVSPLVPIGSRIGIISPNNAVNIAGLPNTTSSGFIKVFARTDDGAEAPRFCGSGTNTVADNSTVTVPYNAMPWPGAGENNGAAPVSFALASSTGVINISATGDVTYEWMISGGDLGPFTGYNDIGPDGLHCNVGGPPLAPINGLPIEQPDNSIYSGALCGAFLDASNHLISTFLIQSSASIAVPSNAVTLTLGGNWASFAYPPLSDHPVSGSFSVNVSHTYTTGGKGGNIAGLTSSVGTITVHTYSPHGFIAGDIMILTACDGASVAGVTIAQTDGLYKVQSVVDSTHFTVSNPATPAYSADFSEWDTGAPMSLGAVTSAPSGTGAAITTMQAGDPLTTQTAVGVAQSTIGGMQPGYQFYMAYYNCTTGHVGNRMPIGVRIANTGGPAVFQITGLPDLSPVNPEWVKMIGRTGDGAEVPYPICDSAVNWITVPNNVTSLTVSQPDVDFNSEMPVNNGICPSFDKVIRIADRVYVNGPNSPIIYISETIYSDITAKFVGKPEQSFGGDQETFPTGDNVTCMLDYEGIGYFFTLGDCAGIADNGGIRMWQGGPWPIGCAGPRAACRTPYGLFWFTPEKQLAMMGPNGPMVVSEEYEAGLLAVFGDTTLGSVELVYMRSGPMGIDHVKISGLDASGNSYQVIHDFRLQDDQNPLGQGRAIVYSGDLATPCTMAACRTPNGLLCTYSGSSTGNVYQLDSGNDDSGTAFIGDYIGLVNFGSSRPSVPMLEWIGDDKIQLSMLKEITGQLSDFLPLEVDQYPGKPDQHHWRAFQTDSTEILEHAYVRIQLTSHASAPTPDALLLNNPPRVPVEVYGRLYVLRPDFGEQRGGPE
jgi:hypothetical protein